jgi:hypothetical protein
MTTRYVDPAAGGDNDGSSWINAWTSIQSAFDTAVAGETVYCRGTQTVAAQIDVDTQTGGNATGFIKFVGCNASGNVDGTRFTIQGDGANACDLIYKTGAMHMIWLENIRLTAAFGTKSGISSDTTGGVGWVFVNVSFDNNTSNGFTNGRYIIAASFFRCTFYSNGAAGYSGTSNPSDFFLCSFHDNTGTGLSSGSGLGTVYGCVLHGNGDDGYAGAPGSFPTSFINCVIDGNTDDGIFISSNSSNIATVIIGSRITNHSGAGDIGLNCASEPVITAYCYFEDNDGDNIQNATVHQFIPAVGTETTSNVEDQADTTEGYVSTTGGSEDFSTNYVDGTDPSLRRTAITIPWT